MTAAEFRGAATQIHSATFDKRYFALSEKNQGRIDGALYEMGKRLVEFSHHRMRGTKDCRLRVGDYRIIYNVDIEQNTVFLLTVGHRRDIYR